MKGDNIPFWTTKKVEDSRQRKRQKEKEKVEDMQRQTEEKDGK